MSKRDDLKEMRKQLSNLTDDVQNLKEDVEVLKFWRENPSGYKLSFCKCLWISNAFFNIIATDPITNRTRILEFNLGAMFPAEVQLDVKKIDSWHFTLEVKTNETTNTYFLDGITEIATLMLEKTDEISTNNGDTASEQEEMVEDQPQS